jgi:ribosome recycling factor
MPASGIIGDAGERMKKAIAAVGHEFSTVRTGRASAAVLEDIKVDYYGTPTPLNTLAGISVPEPQMLLITPYDKTALKATEKAIQASELGLNPSNDGSVIRLPFPPLTEERRHELVKLCHGYTESGRVAVRNIRRDAIEHLKKQEREHAISEDDLRRAESEIQKLTDANVHEIDDMLKRKEQEIMEV